MPKMNVMTSALEERAVDFKALSTNFVDMISECEPEFDPKNEIQNRYPLVAWLLNTEYARKMRAWSTDPQKFHHSAEEGVEWEMESPASIWTLEPSNEGDDCCWTLPDFAKCSATLPLYLLCLKDCDKIFDKLVFDRLRINERTAIDGVSVQGETVEQTNERIRRMWMAFYTAHTAIVGTSTTADNITKPFHGLLEVLENNAVPSVLGTNPLAAFESLACRMAVLGGLEGIVFATNPLIYMSLDALVVPGQDGTLPKGWSRVNGELRFMGRPFIQDKLVPVDMTNSTGEVWMLAGDAVGLFLGTNIMPEENFIVRDDFTEETKANGCGTKCTYYYNFGAVGNNNANRLAVISGIPVDSACTSTIADLADLINPSTLIPA